jgi:hypothetical protein
MKKKKADLKRQVPYTAFFFLLPSLPARFLLHITLQHTLKNFLALDVDAANLPF